LDTNNYYIALEIGRHYVSLGDYAKASDWIERSLNLNGTPEVAATWDLLMKNMRDPITVTHK
jgi:hypothetical protein